MGEKRLPMRKLREILRLKYARRMGHRAIARACGVGVGTVSEYVSRARDADLSWPLPSDLDDGTLEAQEGDLPARVDRLLSLAPFTCSGKTKNDNEADLREARTRLGRVRTGTLEGKRAS